MLSQGYPSPNLLKRNDMQIDVISHLIIQQNIDESLWKHENKLTIIVATLALARNQGKGVASVRAYK